MINDGSKIKHMEAQIIGGAYNSGIYSKNIGRENIITARKILRRYRIRIVSEDVGGEKGRKVIFDTGSNEIVILKVEKLREGDWNPYMEAR